MLTPGYKGGLDALVEGTRGQQESTGINGFWEELGLGCRAGAGEDVEGTERLSRAEGSPKQGPCGQHPAEPYPARAERGKSDQAHSLRAHAKNSRANVGQEHYRT